MLQIFNGLIPKDLSILRPDISDTKTDIKKIDKKLVDGNNQKVIDTDKDKKDDSEIHQSEISDDERKDNNANQGQKHVKVLKEQELEQKIYIVLSETPTQIFYFSPSTTYISNPKYRKLNIIYSIS